MIKMNGAQAVHEIDARMKRKEHVNPSKTHKSRSKSQRLKTVK